MILITGDSVSSEFFVGRTVQGHYIVFAFHKAVAVALNNGAIFKRLKYTAGALGHKIDVALSTIVASEQWNGHAEIAECSEQEWPGGEAMAATATALPPAPPEMLAR